MYNEHPTLLEKVISALTYLSAGFVGFVWIIIMAVRRTYPSKFVMFHIMQSIFLSLGYVIINYVFWHVVNLISYIPFINRIVRQLVYIFNQPYVFGYSFMQCIIYGTLMYLVVFAFMGLYAYIPVVSDIIKSNFRD